MESKYQVVSIKENPFQRAGDVTFRRPSPSFTTDFFLCSFLSSPLPHSISLSLLLCCSDFQVREAFISLRWVLNCCFGLDPAQAEVQSCEVLRTIPWPFPLELLHSLSWAGQREGKTIHPGSVPFCWTWPALPHLGLYVEMKGVWQLHLQIPQLEPF